MKLLICRKPLIASKSFKLARMMATLALTLIAAVHSNKAVATELYRLDDGTPFEAFPDYQGFQPIWHPNDAESDLLKVTSDAMNGALILKAIMSDTFSLLELKYVTSENVTLDMRLEDLAKGVVLMKSGNYDVIKLVGNDIKPDSGGNLDLVYLSDGVWNHYKSFPMTLKGSGNQWGFQTRESNRPNIQFNTMYLKKKTFFGKTIGLESVTVGTVQ